MKDLKLGSKKGQVGGIQPGFYALMFMAIAIVIVVVINAFGAEFVEDQQNEFGPASCTTGTFTSYNSTSKLCYNATGQTSNLVGTAGWNVTESGLNAQETLSEGTEDVTDVGIITIVLGLLVALIGIFGIAGYRAMR